MSSRRQRREVETENKVGCASKARSKNEASCAQKGGTERKNEASCPDKAGIEDKKKETCCPD